MENLTVEDLKSQNHDGSAILMGELTDPVANGMYFNHVNDFKNSVLALPEAASVPFSDSTRRSGHGKL